MNDLPMLYVYTPDLTRNDGAPDEQPLVFATPRDDATPYVPAARLDAANLEIARLRTALDSVLDVLVVSGGRVPVPDYKSLALAAIDKADAALAPKGS